MPGYLLYPSTGWHCSVFFCVFSMLKQKGSIIEYILILLRALSSLDQWVGTLSSIKMAWVWIQIFQIVSWTLVKTHCKCWAQSGTEYKGCWSDLFKTGKKKKNKLMKDCHQRHSPLSALLKITVSVFCLSQVKESALDLRGWAAPLPRSGRWISWPMGGHAGRRNGSMASLRAAEVGGGAQQGRDTPTLQE